MEQQKTSTLTTIFSEVLANLAFMFTDEDPADTSAAGTWLETFISYEGPVKGTLRFQCPREFCVLLAGNLLGIDPQDDDAESRAEDAVKEFMNILCGQFITTTHGTDDVFNLTIPETRELGERPDSLGGDDAWASTLTVEGHTVQLTYAHDDNADR